MNVITCKNLTYLYSVGTPFETAAISDVSLDINENELVGIIGHTGSGKSTLIQHLNGLLEPSSGTVTVNGKDIWLKKNKKNIRNVRFEVGLCFQYPEYQIFEESVYKEIAFGPKQMGLDDDEIKQRIINAMEFVGIDKSLANKSPFDLSGGQKRRVAIASIIAMKPKVLILDEPCAGLDPKGRDVILNLIKEYKEKTNSTVIFVSHSMEDVAKICERVIVMSKSKIVYDSTVKGVFSHSKELKEMGLNVPEITDIFLKLNDSGIPCKTDIFTVDEACKEIKRLKESGVNL